MQRGMGRHRPHGAPAPRGVTREAAPSDEWRYNPASFSDWKKERTMPRTVRCARFAPISQVQANLGQPLALQPGRLPFPPDNKFRCPGCGAETDLGDLRRQIEAQSRKPVVA
jgi:hypothetical protein